MLYNECLATLELKPYSDKGNQPESCTYFTVAALGHDASYQGVVQYRVFCSIVPVLRQVRDAHGNVHADERFHLVSGRRTPVLVRGRVLVIVVDRRALPHSVRVGGRGKDVEEVDPKHLVAHNII